MATPKQFTTPVGRLVQGSLYDKYQKKDDKGNLVLSTKPGEGFNKPIDYYFFAVAIPKAGEQHWASTSWGAVLWAAGHEGDAAAGQRPTFAWKVTDGDSQVPNARNKKPCEQEGFPGNWVISFKSSYAPKVANAVTGAPAWDAQPNLINLGDFVEVNASTVYNANTQKPGVYINPSAVCLRGYGPRISVGPDLASAGFGAAPLPGGASLTPLAGAPMPPVPGAAMAPPPPPAPMAAVAPPPPPAPAPVVVVPNPAILQVAPPPAPAAAAVVAPPAPPPAAARQVRNPAGQVFDHAALLAAGWTDATLAANGYTPA